MAEKTPTDSPEQVLRLAKWARFLSTHKRKPEYVYVMTNLPRFREATGRDVSPPVTPRLDDTTSKRRREAAACVWRQKTTHLYSVMSEFLGTSVESDATVI